MRTLAIASLLLACACGTPELGICGDPPGQTVRAGLTGVLDGEPTVEVQLRAPQDDVECAFVDSLWLFLDESDNTLRVEPPPESGELDRSTIRGSSEEGEIVFRGRGLSVELDSPSGRSLRLSFIANGNEVAVAECQATGDALACNVTGS